MTIVITPNEKTISSKIEIEGTTYFRSELFKFSIVSNDFEIDKIEWRYYDKDGYHFLKNHSLLEREFQLKNLLDR